ncbi:MAG: glycerol-3-phosphate dehydrogenase, partial [Solirubrobacteraceae bacterium]|nr:glycerol-3-phosphate dehydrogenase [Solirubrobacteraceae bacterium]
REALLERGILTSLAPHLVRPLPMVVPSFGGKRPDRMLGTGLTLYDGMARELRRGGDQDWSPDRHRIIEGDEVLKLVPALEPRNPTAGYLFYDCQTDDARLVLTVLGEAERFGAIVANRLEVRDLIHDESGWANAVRVADGLSGDEFEIRAGTIVNATGVWADRISTEEFYAAEEVPRIRPSRGTHLTVAQERLPLAAGAIVPAGKRTIFVLPWLGRTLIGTTDADYEGELDHIAPSAEDIDYLLGATNKFFETEITPEELTGAYAGVRPLISTGDPKKSVDISRRAELYETSSGMLTITGGKLTTFRRMAKHVVDRLVERDGRDAPCRTHEIPLGMEATPEDLPAMEGVEEDTYKLLAHRYGHAARAVLDLAEEREELRARIVPDLPDLLAEVVIAARAEQAASVGDVMLRRTRLGLLAAPEVCAEDSEPARAVARVLGAELGWDDARVDSELAAWREEAAAEGIALQGVVAA